MTTLNKVKWVIATLFVFLLIFATNRIDKNNFMRIEQSVERIYKEQLQVKDAMLGITQIVHQKEVAFLQMDSTYFEKQAIGENARALALLKQCNHGNLDKKEEHLLSNLRDGLNRLANYEVNLASDSKADVGLYQEAMRNIKKDIDQLVEVQMEKGRTQKLLSRDAVASSKLFYQIEIYFLIAIAVSVQLIILFPFSRKSS